MIPINVSALHKVISSDLAVDLNLLKNMVSARRKFGQNPNY